MTTTLYIPVIPDGSGFQFATPGTGNPKPIAQIPAAGKSAQFARADHEHVNLHFRHHYYDEDNQVEYSYAQWGEEADRVSMRFYGWGFNSGKPTYEKEFEYAWGSHFRSKFLTAAAGYGSGTEHNETALSYEPNNENYQAGTKVLLANRLMTQVRTHNNGQGARPLIDGGYDASGYKEFTAVYGTRSPIANNEAYGENVNYLARVGDDYVCYYQDNNKPLIYKANKAGGIFFFGGNNDVYGSSFVPQLSAVRMTFDNGVNNYFYYNGQYVSGSPQNQGSSEYGKNGATYVGNTASGTCIYGSSITMSKAPLYSDINSRGLSDNTLGLGHYVGNGGVMYDPLQSPSSRWKTLNFGGGGTAGDNVSLMIDATSQRVFIRFRTGENAYSFKEISFL